MRSGSDLDQDWIRVREGVGAVVKSPGPVDLSYALISYKLGSANSTLQTSVSSSAKTVNINSILLTGLTAICM